MHDQIHALRRHKPGNQCNHRNVSGRKPQLLLESTFAGRLSGQILLAVIRGDQRIPSRIVSPDIDAVQDSGQLMLIAADDLVKAEGKDRVLQLLRICRADRAQHIAALDGALHQIHVAAEIYNIFLVLRQAETGFQNVFSVMSLVFNVVNREHRPGKGLPHQRILVYGHQSGLPVVSVYDIRMEIRDFHGGEHSAAEICETLAVVVIAVESVPLEVIFIVDEIIHRPVLFQLEQADVLISPGHRDPALSKEFHLFAEFVADFSVQRQNDPAVHPCLPAPVQCGRQRSRDFSQASRCGEGSAFRCHKEYAPDRLRFRPASCASARSGTCLPHGSFRNRFLFRRSFLLLFICHNDSFRLSVYRRRTANPRFRSYKYLFRRTSLYIRFFQTANPSGKPSKNKTHLLNSRRKSSKIKL